MTQGNEHHPAMVGRGRNGEGPLWKYVRLWPIVLAIGSVIAAYAVMADNQSDLEKAQVKIDNKVDQNSVAIQLLEQQGVRVDGHLIRIDEKLGDQKGDIKDILIILRSRNPPRP